MDTVVSAPARAVTSIRPASSIALGGFGLCGIPSVLIGALPDAGVDGLTAVSNNCGVGGQGLGLLLGARRMREVSPGIGVDDIRAAPPRRSPCSSMVTSDERHCCCPSGST